jgi:hypothetical protein
VPLTAAEAVREPVITVAEPPPASPQPEPEPELEAALPAAAETPPEPTTEELVQSLPELFAPEIPSSPEDPAHPEGDKPTQH